MRNNPFITAIEAYLLVGFVMHAGTAAVTTWGKRRYVRADPWRRGGLALTGAVLLYFLIQHLRDFRFGDVSKTTDGVDDLYARAVTVLSDPANCVLYCAGSASLGVHLWVGWEKAVPRLPLPAADRGTAAGICRLLSAAVAAGFAACVLLLSARGGA